MGCSRSVYFLLAVWAVASIAHAQRQQMLPEVSRAELETVLSTKAGATRVVNCLVNFVEGCDRRLMNIGRTVPALLSNNFNCKAPLCSPQTAGNVRFFVVTMQTSYPRLWSKLISNAQLI